MRPCVRFLNAVVPRKKFQVAIIGAGPSGCYVGDALIKKSEDVHVDFFEKRPVPFGLSRYGVAPDHADVKNVERGFVEMFSRVPSRASYFGNIDVGRMLTVDELLASYSAVVVASGATDDHRLGIDGEFLRNVVTARRFVDYYNTTPAPEANPMLCPLDLDSCSTVLIIGNGNVAIDCARVLAAPYKHFCPTDMNFYAIKALMTSKVKHIEVIGRRGPEASAFTTKEFRELTAMNTIAVGCEPFDLDATMKSPAGVGGGRALSRKMELLHSTCCPFDSLKDRCKPKDGPSRSIYFRYNLKPVKLLGDKEKKVFAAVFQSSGADGTTSEVIVPCDAVIKSLGVRAEAFRGVPFDEVTNRIPNVDGRVVGAPRVYTTGWISNGAKGVILQSMINAKTTAQCILEDCLSGVLPSDTPGKFGVMELLADRQAFPVLWKPLQRIWKVEEERGIDWGKKSEKVNSIPDMMDIVMGGRVGRRTTNRVTGRAEGRPRGLELLEDLLDEDTEILDMSNPKRVNMTPNIRA